MATFTPTRALQKQIDAVVDATDFGRASASKRGGFPQWPYIAVVVHANGRTHNPLGRRAYATREEAVAAADAHINTMREHLRRSLAEPRMRALREQHGLPREVS